MGQGASRLFNGDEAFVRQFYDAYLQGGERLDMWDAPTVKIGKLAEQLDAIQGVEIHNQEEGTGESRFEETVVNDEDDGIISLGNNRPRNEEIVGRVYD